MASERTKLSRTIKTELEATDSDIASLTKSIDSFLFKKLSKLLKPLEADGVDAAEFQQVLGSLRSSLQAAGLNDVLKRLDGIYGKQLEYVRNHFSDLGKEKIFSDVDLNIIQTLIDYDFEKTTGRIDQYVTDVKKSFQTAVLSGEKPSFADVHDRIGPGLASNLETEVTTTMQGFASAVTAGKAKELGFDLFIYIGPDDDVTRDFCSELLSKDPPIYTQDEIDSLDNGQGLSVMIFRGGYNCRHQWRPITEEKAKELGYVD